MTGKSLTEIKEAELADARERMAADRSELLRFDLRPRGFWWHLDEWSRRFKKMTKWLSAFVGLVTVAAGVPVAIAGLRAWRTRNSVAPAELPPHPGERLATDRVQEPDAGRMPPK